MKLHLKMENVQLQLQANFSIYRKTTKTQWYNNSSKGKKSKNQIKRKNKKIKNGHLMN